MRRCVPPHPGGMPIVTSGCPILALFEAMRMSHAIASSQPPPSAKPLTAAITGFSSRSILFITPCAEVLPFRLHGLDIDHVGNVCTRAERALAGSSDNYDLDAMVSCKNVK